MRKTLLALCFAGSAAAQSYYPSENLRTQIVAIGDWNMYSSPAVRLNLPSGIDPKKIVHLSAMIYSDPIGTSAAVFRIDHFASAPLVSGAYQDVLLGGMIKLEHDGTAYKIILDRDSSGARHTPLFQSNGASRLVDGTAVSFQRLSYNRGNIRIVYIP